MSLRGISNSNVENASSSLKYALFDKLYDSEDSDLSCPLFQFTTELLQKCAGIVENHNGSKFKNQASFDSARASEVAAEMVKDIAREEEELSLQISVQQHAKDKLVIELKRTEAFLEQLSAKQKVLRVRKKLAQTVVAKTTLDFDTHLATTLMDMESDDANKLESFLRMLRSKVSKEDAVVKALQQFESFCILVVEAPWSHSTMILWTEIVSALVGNLSSSLPRLQIIQLRILSEVLKRNANSVNVHTLGRFQLQQQQQLQNNNNSIVSNDDAATQVVSALMIKTYSIVANSESLPVFIRLLSSINDDVKAEAAACISAACGSIPTKELFGQLGGVDALIRILNKANNETVLHQALVALWNMAMADSNKALVREVGGLPSIIAMLHIDNETILENATIALGYLTRDDNNKVVIRDCHGIEKLLATLRFPNESIQSKAAGALWNCASNTENKVFIRQLGGIATLIELLSSSFESVQENAAGGLWNCAVDTENKKLVRELGGLEPLIALLSSSNPSIVENASGTLWNCAAVAENRVALRKLGGLLPLLQLLRSSNENIQENGAGAIRNCSFNDQNKVAYRELGGINLFVELLDRVAYPVLEKIISTLLICSINAENKDAICAAGGFKKLLDHSLNHSEACIREKALGILRNCSTTSQNRSALLQSQGIHKLVKVLEGPVETLTTPIKEYAAASLWNLARDDDSKSLAREEGAIQTLVRLLNDTAVGVVENAAGALLSLTLNAENRDHLRAIGGVNRLVSLLTSPNEFILENVVGALKNCTSNNDANAQLVRELGGLQHLVRLLSATNDNLVREVTLCLKNLALNEDNSALIGKAGGVAELVRLVQSTTSTDLIRKVAAFALQSLSKHPLNRRLLDHLQALATSSNTVGSSSNINNISSMSNASSNVSLSNLHSNGFLGNSSLLGHNTSGVSLQ